MASSGTPSNITKATTATAEVEQTFPLLKLPPELRNQIYKEVLVVNSVLRVSPKGDSVTDISNYSGDMPPWKFCRALEPSLLATCKQIRQEALLVFYADNTFRDTVQDRCLLILIRRLSPTKRLMLGNVQISEYVSKFPSRVRDAECVFEAQGRLQDMKNWLQRNGVVLRDDAVQVFTRLNDDANGTWTNSPEGRCELRRCQHSDM